MRSISISLLFPHSVTDSLTDSLTRKNYPQDVTSPPGSHDSLRIYKSIAPGSTILCLFCVPVCLCEHVHVCVCVNICVCMVYGYVCVCVNMCMCMCMYLFALLCFWMCVYVYVVVRMINKWMYCMKRKGGEGTLNIYEGENFCCGFWLMQPHLYQGTQKLTH